MQKEIRNFFTGFRALFNGMRLITNNRDIRRMAIIPFILYFVTLVIVFGYGVTEVPGWVERGVAWALPADDTIWAYLFYWPMYILVLGAFLGLLIFVGYVIAMVIASPFNSLLAETTLEQLRAKPTSEFSMKRWLTVSAKMMWTALLKSALFLCYGALFFAVSFIPVIGILASVGMLLIMSFDSADYTFECLEYNLNRRLRFFRRNFMFFLGSSAALGLTLFIPGLNFLLFPAAIVGHAELVQKRMKQ